MISAFVGDKDVFAVILTAWLRQVLVFRLVAIHIPPHHEEDRLHSYSADIADDGQTAALLWISDRVCGGDTTQS